ncbi:MAG: TrkA C-terminal domain-containing protein [Planctomycetota bacterium]|nr:TrkA C-terminal domain-containing protein [Planctomycetota bacterium]
MLPIISLIVVLIVSMVVVRVATVALTLTGLSRDLSRFQARSAFTGAGFTTGESELVVGHPVRRRIIMILMLLGNAGFVTVISTLVISFTREVDPESWVGSIWTRLGLLFGGLFILILFVRSHLIDEWMSRVIKWCLKNWTSLDTRDYANLLHFRDEYAVSELKVHGRDWLANNPLSDLQLSHEGVLVLGINREDGSFVGAPRGKTRIEEGDTLLVYGRETNISELDTRRRGKKGEHKHIKAVAEQTTIEQHEDPDQPT